MFNKLNNFLWLLNRHQERLWSFTAMKFYVYDGLKQNARIMEYI